MQKRRDFGCENAADYDAETQHKLSLTIALRDPVVV